MTDIVEWLRNSTSAEWNGPMLNKAADEIERLRRVLMEVECELNAATDGKYLPHKWKP
jgi:hypothetical protein